MSLKEVQRDAKIDPNARVAIPITHLPIFRTKIAVDSGVEKNILLKTWGGLGDQICAEPTLRFAIRSFKGCSISLASERPELFQHLNFNKTFDLKEVQPNYSNFLLLDTITPPDDSNLVWQFFSHMLVNCVDFPSMCALRCQIPVEDKEILIRPTVDEEKIKELKIPQNAIFIHAGRHWQSKTFPKDWWDSVLDNIIKFGHRPVLIGADTDDNRGTVDVNVQNHTIDLRNKLSIQESIWLLQRAKVLLTNDSSPLHMAASSDPSDLNNTGLAWIGFIATCKHPDYIMHWRKGHWAWREKNFGRGGIWDIIDYCPNKDNEVTADKVPEDMLLSWLPDPSDYAAWAVSKAQC